MSNDIRSILERLSAVEGKLTPVGVKHGLNAQQKSAGQLPALFKPKDISPTLTKKPYQKHPMDGKLVGDSVERVGSPLEEAMQEVEEDMLAKVKHKFADYLEKLEKQNHLDSHLVRKAKADLDIADDEDEMEEAAWDQDVAPVSGPMDAGDSEVAHGLEDQVANQVSQPTGPVKTFEMDDGTCLECWGDESSGFELRRNGKSLPTRFPEIGHADMAVKLFSKRKAKQAQQQELAQDYVEEK
jgi:hypothetical protein